MELRSTITAMKNSLEELTALSSQMRESENLKIGIVITQLSRKRKEQRSVNIA